MSEMEFYKFMYASKTRDGRRAVMLKRLMKRVEISMGWMISDMDFRNRIDDSMGHIDSPELDEAKNVLADIKSYLEKV